MASNENRLPLGAFLSGRQVPDAQDLMDIRTRIAEIGTRLEDISSNNLSRAFHHREQSDLKAELAKLGTAEIIAREHVRANPSQSRNLEIFEQQKTQMLREQAKTEAVRVQAESRRLENVEKLQYHSEKERSSQENFLEKKDSVLDWVKRRRLVREKSRSLKSRADDDGDR